jgi:hypothetical protein
MGKSMEGKIFKYLNQKKREKKKIIKETSRL